MHTIPEASYSPEFCSGKFRSGGKGHAVTGRSLGWAVVRNTVHSVSALLSSLPREAVLSSIRASEMETAGPWLHLLIFGRERRRGSRMAKPLRQVRGNPGPPGVSPEVQRPSRCVSPPPTPQNEECGQRAGEDSRFYQLWTQFGELAYEFLTSSIYQTGWRA